MRQIDSDDEEEAAVFIFRVDMVPLNFCAYV